jgi:hypothetical protein
MYANYLVGWSLESQQINLTSQKYQLQQTITISHDDNHHFSSIRVVFGDPATIYR